MEKVKQEETAPLFPTGNATPPGPAPTPEPAKEVTYQPIVEKEQKMEVIPRSEQYLSKAEEDSLSFMNPKRWQVMSVMAQTFVQSGALPKGIKNAAQIIMCLQAGYEAGMQPIESLGSFAPINGRMTMYGDAVISQVIKAGHKIEWGIFKDPLGKAEVRQCDNMSATVTITRGDNGTFYSMTYDIARADSAGLTQVSQYGPGPWQKYPERMLRYKVFADVAHFIVPDALRGVMIQEEMEIVPEDPKGATKGWGTKKNVPVAQSLKKLKNAAKKAQKEAKTGTPTEEGVPEVKEKSSKTTKEAKKQDEQPAAD